MAQGPVARRGSTTVALPTTGQTATALSSRALVGIKKVFFTEADVSDPKKLYQVIYQGFQALNTALRPLLQSPLVGANLIQNQQCTGGATTIVYHRLGRAYTGYLPVLDSGVVPDFKIGTLPAGVTTKMAIPLIATNSGTYSLLVF